MNRTKMLYFTVFTAFLASCSNTTPITDTLELETRTSVGLSGDLGFHDATLFNTGGFCGFSTGIERTTVNPGGILVHKSSGSYSGSWSTIGEIPVPGWAFGYSVKNIWAPDLVQNGSTYYLYYAASKFGTNSSAIGVMKSTNPCATNTWTDLGAIKTSSGQAFNAIDPDVGWDSTNGWFMTWGSFFSGIQMQKMSSMTSFTGSVVTVASRPGVATNPVEAPSILKRGSFYYLFASWDLCCRGTSSTYKTVVGRSTTLFGPYLDKAGKRMDQGGGTIILQGSSGSFGPGGGDVFQSGSDYFFAYHIYDAAGSPKLRVNKLTWDSNNWPVP